MGRAPSGAIARDLFNPEVAMSLSNRLPAVEPVPGYGSSALGRGWVRRGLGGDGPGRRPRRPEVHPARHRRGGRGAAAHRGHPRHPPSPPARRPVRHPGRRLPGDRHAAVRREPDGPAPRLPGARAGRACRATSCSATWRTWPAPSISSTSPAIRGEDGSLVGVQHRDIKLEDPPSPLVARTMPSLKAIRMLERTKVLREFCLSPMPAAPQSRPSYPWVQQGADPVKDAWSPPIMKVRLPLSAPGVEPVTGASRNRHLWP